MTLLSLSEVEAVAFKAARGAGMEWGLAEEASFATRWLVAQGLDGMALLAAHLKRIESQKPGRIVPDGRRWTSGPAGPLCPIATGAALSDSFALAEGLGQGALDLAAVASPAFLLPFLATSAGRNGAVVLAAWEGMQAVLAEGRLLAMTGDALGLATVPGVSLICLPGWAGHSTRADVAADVAETLNRLVFRTFVPASAQSRLGAGAMGTDNI